MDPLGAEDGAAGGEDHQEDNYDAEQDEGAGPQREILQVTSCQCSWHGWRFRALLLTATQSSSSSAFHRSQPDPDWPTEKWRIYQVITALLRRYHFHSFIYFIIYGSSPVREIFIFYLFSPNWNFSQFPSFLCADVSFIVFSSIERDVPGQASPILPPAPLNTINKIERKIQ